MASELILIVDDEPAMRELLTERLGSCAYETVATANGREALLLLASGLRPAAILLDLSMPVMSGSEFYARSRGFPEIVNVPIIVLSASADLGDGRVPPVGGDRVLTKPIDFPKLFELLEQLCN